MHRGGMAGGWIQPRPQLEQRLDAALTRRLTTVVAAAGFGKTILLERWTAAVGGSLHRLTPQDRDPTRMAGDVVSALRLRVPDLPSELTSLDATLRGPDRDTDDLGRAEVLAGAVAEALTPRLRGDLALVLDGIDAVVDSPGAVRFVETLLRVAPWRLHLVVAGREPLPFLTGRLRRQDEVLDVDATDLRLSPEETRAWAESRLGKAGAEVAGRLHARTAGWPIAVHASIDRHAAAGSERSSRSDPTDPPEMLEELIREEFDALEPATRWLLQAATVLPVLDDATAERLDAGPGTLALLLARGLFLEPAAGGYALTATSRQVLLRHAPLHPEDARVVVATVTPWYLERGRPELALRAAVAAGDPAAVERLAVDHGDRLADHPDDVLAAFEGLPDEVARRPSLTRVAGIAYQNRGDWDRSRQLLSEVAEGDGFDASVAWRLGFIHHLRGELEPALATYRRGMVLEPAVDAAICTANAATVLWLVGDRDGCATLADRAIEMATALGDARALAAAHTVLAMLAALDGDRRANDAHYLRALEHAERAGDLSQQIRIRCNRASHHTEEGAHAEALVELDIATRLSELTGFAPLEALALSNRAETLVRLGRLEEAAVDAGDAVARWRAMGSRLVGYGLVQLAQVQHLRGDTPRAVASLEEAIEQSESARDVQGLVPALAALSGIVSADDPQRAAALARRAVGHGEGMGGVAARIALARSLMAGGDRLEARRVLDDARRLARARNDRAGGAEVVMLLAELDRDRDGAAEALALWDALGDPIGRARAELVLARLEDPAAAAPLLAGVRQRLHALGCRAFDAATEGLPNDSSASSLAPVAVETLGRFRVWRAGQLVPHRAWQSRKARDLLKILISHRGRPLARERLAAVLWEIDDDTDEAVARKRLNVMLSTLRSVLDPERRFDADHFVASDGAALHVDLDHVDVDVERFLAAAELASRLDTRGRPEQALVRWRQAEELYAGDFCEGDAYAEWAVSLREQARLVYAQAVHRIADAATAAARYEDAARYWLRLLERDPYDERGHIGLVRALHLAGRRGDANRRYRAYLQRMRDLDLEPASYPAAPEPGLNRPADDAADRWGKEGEGANGGRPAGRSRLERW